MMQVDDFAVGSWTMITGLKVSNRDDSPPGISPLAGLPLEIKGIALPFMAAAVNGGEVIRVDTRLFSFGRVTIDYRDAIIGKVAAAKPEVSTEDDSTLCKRCRGKMRQRRSFVDGSWQWVCQNGCDDGDEMIVKLQK